MNFPNGFDNWQETHYEIVAYLTETLDNEDLMSFKTRASTGQGGVYELAKSLTNIFEKLYVDIVWGKNFDYYAEIAKFLTMKEQQYAMEHR